MDLLFFFCRYGTSTLRTARRAHGGNLCALRGRGERQLNRQPEKSVQHAREICAVARARGSPAQRRRSLTTSSPPQPTRLASGLSGRGPPQRRTGGCTSGTRVATKSATLANAMPLRCCRTQIHASTDCNTARVRYAQNSAGTPVRPFLQEPHPAARSVWPNDTWQNAPGPARQPSS